MDIDRRAILALAAGGASLAACQVMPQSSRVAGAPQTFEGQRAPDLGNGTFLNPVLAGDHPDPTILKDGDDFYATFSSFEYLPGLPTWHSRDLVNWEPIGAALTKPLGTVYAPDLIKHDGRYFIYFPALNYQLDASGNLIPKPGKPVLATFVVHADSMQGPWSEPIDLKIAAIDPGHAVGEDGKRYLFVNDGRRVQLADDGLSAVGQLEKVYDGWKYPGDWVVEGYSLEGPKINRRGDYFYMTSAVGGTGGPPTGHMVIVARSRSIHGPWEDCPHNPIVRTLDQDEPWWSKGHGTLVEGPIGDSWILYHAYENGRRTLGRQMLLEPLLWTSNGWPQVAGTDLRKPLTKPPGGQAVKHGRAISGPFAAATMGHRFPMFGEAAEDPTRIRYENGDMIVAGRGKTPTDCNPLGAIVGDPRYELTVELELSGKAEGGLILFYSRRAYCGLGSTAERFTYRTTGPGVAGGSENAVGRRLHLRLVNDRDVVSFFHSADGASWTLYRSAEVSGLNHNVFNEFLALRPALYAAGEGEVRFRGVTYRSWGN